MVIAATWRDLGYRRIGPRKPQDADDLLSTEQLAALFKQVGGYHIEHDNNGWWIRDPARVKGYSRSDAVAIAAVLDAANYADPDQYGFVQMLQAGYYSDYQFALSPVARHDQVVTFSQNPRAAKGTYALTFALAGCPIPELQQFLSSVLLPAFFNAFRNGKVVFLRPNYKFETRHAGMRAGYTAIQYGRLDRLRTGQNPFETMERWQPLMPAVQLRLLLELATLVFFPRQQYFTGTRSGLLSVFIPGEPFVEHRQPFPASWRDLFTDHYDFAKGERYIPNLATLATTGPAPDSLTAILDQAVHGASDIERLIRWLVDRYNALSFHQTEPTEFLDGELVDFVTCFEHALTLDRSLRKGLSCVVSAESAIRKESAMEIADILGELASYWAGTKDGPERFKKLVHPAHGLALLKTALGAAPAPFDTILPDVATAIYDNLRTTIIGSVFVPAKKSASGILVRSRDLSTENLESLDDFTANVTRALRNTHHGYLTRNDNSSRPSRYLALVNGSLPEAFARLGSLLALAAAVDPETMLGWKFMPVGAFD